MQLNGGFRAGTKLVLWTLFIIQILLIGVLWIYQQGFSTTEDGTNKSFKVNFIKSLERNDWRLEKYLAVQSDHQNQTFFNYDTSSKFAIDFQTITVSDGSNFTCFREGTINSTAVHQQIPSLEQCPCHPEWHGMDCGTPEIVWRALMTAKVPIAISEPRQSPHRVVYMITGYFYSLDLLEIQIKEVWNVVDYFVICHRNSNSNTISMLIKRLNTIFENRVVGISREPKSSNFTKSFYISNTKCTPKLVYKHFQATRPAISSDDIFVFSYEEEILNHRSIQFLKYYYDNTMGLIRFRLKYNVYGFYWQHPESTIIAGVISSFRQLDESYKSDPERLYKAKKKSMIFGDLNHIGGWYCAFCYRSNEIIQKLQFVANQSPKFIIHHKFNKNGQIDDSYIQNLIATGLYIDGKLGLNKLHRFSDNYYAPKYVEQNAWKFDNILVNLFLTFNDDDDYEK